MTERLLLTAAQMRWADHHAIDVLGIASAQLMEHAGRCVAEAVLQRLYDGHRVLVVAGPGNNGGDGFVAASILHEENIPVQCVLLGDMETLLGDAATYASQCQAAGVCIAACPDEEGLRAQATDFLHADIIVDAMFGTGLTRSLEGVMAVAVDAINASAAQVLSVDIASGIDSDHGRVMGRAVAATWTLPIAACKWGHWLDGGRELGGEVLTPAQIGIPHEVIEQAMREVESPAVCARLIGQLDVHDAFPCRSRTAHKRDFGHVWIFGGSVGYSGAPRLAGMGAFAVGAGLVSIACPEEIYPVVASSSLEMMVHPQQSAPWREADVVLAGPGWGSEQQTMLSELMASPTPLVLDADGLNMLVGDQTLAAALLARTGVSVLTPHPGEAGRLLGRPASKVQEDRLACVLALADQFHCWVVLKGADSLIASPGGNVWLCPFGSPRMATAGTGDVLAGMIAALLGRGLEASAALPAAVGLHALAGEKEDWHLAGELADVVRQITPQT
ncbi:MAG: NAD(P)H-hydrate dehydratase [Mariprofundaceae bacterium]